MGQPAAKKGDQITAIDTHFVEAPSSLPQPMPLPFTGIINGGLSGNVNIMGMPAATASSTADNTPPHVAPPGTSFQSQPSNKATIMIGSSTVKINGRMAARNGDTAETCNDPADLPVGTVVAAGTVLIG